MRKLFLVLAVLIPAALFAQSNVGKRYPSEKRVIVDRVTGRTLTVLTASSFSDSKPYQTHDTWTADGEWIIFRSARGGNGGQIFVVNEVTGDIVQLTDDPTTNTGSINLSRRNMLLYYQRGGKQRGSDAPATPKQIIELNIGDLLKDAMAGSVKSPQSYERVVYTIPDELNGGGSLALDADESTLYMGVSVALSKAEQEQLAKEREKLQEMQKKHNVAMRNTKERAGLDSQNTDPTEAREAARKRFELAGRGKASIMAIDIKSGNIRKVIDLNLRLGHLQCNPWVAGELIYCHETTGDAVQRMWTVKSDGTGNRPVYVEYPDEWITHETVSGPNELMFAIMGHLPYLREHPTGIAVVSLRNGQMKLLGQVEEDMGNGQQGGFWHVNGSPDGKWAVGDTFKGSIYIINKDTGEKTLLTTGHRMKPDHTHPIFSKDSKRVLIQSGMLTDGKALNLMTVNVPE